MENIERRESIITQNNLTLCRADYFEACWCKLNASEPTICPYLLQYVLSSSNSSHFCIYHTIRKAIECFNSSYIYPKSSVSNLYIYLTISLFIIGLIGNGISIIILLHKHLCQLSVYRNLVILCFLNIIYLLAILIRHINVYEQDLRDVSTSLCHLHTFTIAFIGHLCSWQLVSTSIQRVHALLSLQSHRKTTWMQTWSILIIFIVIPLFIFDSQLLFNYGFVGKQHICNKELNNDVKQLRRALDFPMDISKISNNMPLIYHITWNPSPSVKTDKKSICILWNIIDTFVYAIIPFIVILICSGIIIIKVCQRRRSAVSLGGICHINREYTSPRDYLSTLLITINILFIIMTGPFNICLIVQSIFECFYLTPTSMKIFFVFNEYLSLLQNSYHAISFLFYCVIGNKFRSSAKSVCRTVYCKLLEFGVCDRFAGTSRISCCLDRRRSSSSGQTMSTNSRLSIHENNRRLTVEHRRNSSLPLNVIKRPIYVTFGINQKPITKLTTPF